MGTLFWLYLGLSFSLLGGFTSNLWAQVSVPVNAASSAAPLAPSASLRKKPDSAAKSPAKVKANPSLVLANNNAGSYSLKARSFSSGAIENTEGRQWKSSWRMAPGVAVTSLKMPLYSLGVEWISIPGRSLSFYVATTSTQAINPTNPGLGWTPLQTASSDGQKSGFESFDLSQQFLGLRYNSLIFGSLAYGAGLAVERLSYQGRIFQPNASEPSLALSGSHLQLDASASLGNRWRIFGTFDLAIDWIGVYLPLTRFNEKKPTLANHASLGLLEGEAGENNSPSTPDIPKSSSLFILQTQVSFRF